jgi:hypothetical protein
MTPLLIAFDIGGRSPPVAVCSRLPASASEELGNKKGSGAVCFPQQRILPILLLGIVCLVGSGAAHGFFPTQINTGPSAAGGVSRDTWSPTLRSSDGETLEASTVLRAIARTEWLAEIRSLLTYDWSGATRKKPHFCGKRKNGPPRSKNLREKLQYMHMNPVQRKPVIHPKDWPGSSFSFYAKRDLGLVRIDPLS